MNVYDYRHGYVYKRNYDVYVYDYPSTSASPCMSTTATATPTASRLHAYDDVCDEDYLYI